MTNSTIKIIYNRKSWAKIETDDDELFDNLRMTYTIPNPAAKYSSWASETLCPITLLGSFLIGFTNDIIKTLKELQPDVTIEIDDKLQSILNPFKLEDALSQPLNTEFIYRPFQESSIKLGVDNGRGIILMPTGSGKGLIIYGLATTIINNSNNKHILILVPSLHLVEQLYKDLVEYGLGDITIQKFSSKYPKYEDVNITISNRQWLEKFSEDEVKRCAKKAAKLKDAKKIQKLKDRVDIISNVLPKIKNMDAVIIDELQQIKSSNKVSDFIQSLDTNIRFGLTGTLPDKEDDKWFVKGIVGPILISREVHELQDQGVLADINIIPILLRHYSKPIFNYETPEEYQKAFYDEWNYIESCDEVNNKMLRIIENIKGNTLVVFDHTTHGRYLFDNLKHDKKYFIDGSIDVDYREEVREILETSMDNIIIANTKVFSTGINIKSINTVVLTMHGKSATKIIQTLGRGLRLKDGKTFMTLIDFYHNFKYSKSHFDKRCKLYKIHYNKIVTFKDVNIVNV